MKLATIRPNDIAIVKNDSLIPVGAALARGARSANASMLDLIAQYENVGSLLREALNTGATIKFDSKVLKPPVEKPSKIWAAATNYKRGTGGLDEARGRGTAGTATPEELLERIFLKPPSSV